MITGDDHTFGKGTVQTVTPLPPGLGALKITTARFFRPGGRSTQNDGVSADVVIPSLLATDDFGERFQRYALAGERISPFFGSHANALGPADRGSRVPASTVAQLVASSSARVSASEEFDEVREKLREAEENEGIIKLADILKAREEAKAEEENGDDPEEGEEDELDAQVEEALEVLADLVSLTRQRPRTQTAAQGS